MKKSRILPIVLSALLLSACGSSKSDSYSAGMAMNSAAYEGAAADSYVDYSYAESYDDYDYEYTTEEAEVMSDSAKSASPEIKDESTTNAIQKEMLVYTCRMTVDVLDFQSAVQSCRASIDTYGGFIEVENYSDGGSTSHWYKENSEKWQSYTATIRIPSSNYNDFCNAVGETGYLRSKNASVENFTREYSDLSSSLDIYEAKRERYLALLATITEDEYAISVERELTDIEIEIARIKTRMNTIKNDVAYSYVYLTVNEVKEYVAEPVKTDTFLDRLKVTLSESGEGFLEFLEDFLFFLIYTGPYLIIIGVIVVLIIRSAKKKKAKKAAAKNAAPVTPAQYKVPEKTEAQNTEAPAPDANAPEAESEAPAEQSKASSGKKK